VTTERKGFGPLERDVSRRDLKRQVGNGNPTQRASLLGAPEVGLVPSKARDSRRCVKPKPALGAQILEVWATALTRLTDRSSGPSNTNETPISSH
jgi:hypothetical protein